MKISKSEVAFLLTVFLVCVAAACIVVLGMWFMLGLFVKAFGLEQYHDHFNAALALFVTYKLRQFYVAFRVFKVLMEHKMNNSSEFTDWLLSYCPEKGIGMRYLPEKK